MPPVFLSGQKEKRDRNQPKSTGTCFSNYFDYKTQRLNAYFYTILLLQLKQAFGAEAAIVQFGDVLYLVNA
ncbi:hypothetical protein SRABI27_02792 [Pedobacter sp. Bi27]|nr:hypothetical protein SRABI27_02792 [Pedobacter sp. Bi27]CAH0281108.1 hypothetical protein SRABI126_03771 [Pedobacter sp. Bi126]CAH0307728.1 hypothetical protein SRABI36_04887 [Pedobacter sp. Bi36]